MKYIGTNSKICVNLVILILIIKYKWTIHSVKGRDCQNKKPGQLYIFMQAHLNIKVKRD